MGYKYVKSKISKQNFPVNNRPKLVLFGTKYTKEAFYSTILLFDSCDTTTIFDSLSRKKGVDDDKNILVNLKNMLEQ